MCLMLQYNYKWHWNILSQILNVIFVTIDIHSVSVHANQNQQEGEDMSQSVMSFSAVDKFDSIWFDVHLRRQSSSVNDV